MKKILIYILIIILSCLICAFAFPQKQDTVKRYFHGDNSCIYDLKTFKYDPKNNEFSIDLFYDFDFEGYESLLSPFDKNYIAYLIFSTKYQPETNKLDLKYKGFISATLVIDRHSAWYKEVKIYNNNNVKYIPKLNEYIESLQSYLDDDEKNFYYKQEVTQEIFDAYKKGELYNMKDARHKLYDVLGY